MNIQSTYITRMLEEKKELDEKLAKLKAFFHTPVFLKLSCEDQELLLEQESVMDRYSGILDTRIRRAGHPYA